MVTRRYVVLYGKHGVSNEFRTLASAKVRAKKIAKLTRKPTEVDTLSIRSRTSWSQSMQGVVTPKGRYFAKKNPKANPILKQIYPSIFGKKRRR